MKSRRGYALVTTLWVISVAAVTATVAALTGRNAVNSARNRTLLERSHWAAVGCASRVRASIDEWLDRSEDFADAARGWRVLDRDVQPLAAGGSRECEISLEAAGTRLDVNAASDEMIGNLLRELGYDEGTAGAMVDALADWRDSDSVTRSSGAEAEWYTSMRRDPPRNADIVDAAEIRRIRGFEDWARFESVLAVDKGRISLATAPAKVLAAIPGFTEEAAEVVVALRDAGTPLPTLLSLLELVSTSSRESLLARYPDIARLTTTDPDAWIMTVRASGADPAPTAELRLRLQRVGKRAVVIEGRSRS